MIITIKEIDLMYPDTQGTKIVTVRDDIKRDRINTAIEQARSLFNAIYDVVDEDDLDDELKTVCENNNIDISEYDLCRIKDLYDCGHNYDVFLDIFQIVADFDINIDPENIIIELEV